MLLSKLNETDIRSLVNFRLVMEYKEESEVIPYSHLVNPNMIFNILERIGEKLGAPNDRVTASIVIKRIAFYAVIHFHAMTVLGKKLKVDLQNILLVENGQTNIWLPDFYLGSFEVEAKGSDCSGFRNDVVQHVFAETIYPLIQLFSIEIKLSERMMWENIAIYIFWLYENILSTSDDAFLRDQAAEDLQYIVHDAVGKLFGAYERNPLTRFAGNRLYDEEKGEYKRVRSTCCHSYLLAGDAGKMCATCPLVTTTSP